MMFGLNSFQARLVGWGSLFGAIVLIMMLFINVHSVEQQLERQIVARVQSTETAYRATLAIPLAEYDYATLRDIVDIWKQDDDTVYLVIMDEHGKRLSSAGMEPDGPLPQVGNSGGIRHIRFSIDYLGQYYGTVQYGLSTAYLDEARRELLFNNAIVAIVGMLLSCIMLILVSRHLVKPLLKMGKAAEQISAGDYDIVLKNTGLSELDSLSAHFSNMALAVSNKMSALDWQARHDPLTHAYNRRAFEEHAAVLLADSSTVDVVMLYIDLDQFKAINDSCGHAAGDMLLTRIAHLLETMLDSAFVARIGGDEFGAILSIDREQDCHHLAQRIIDEIAQIHFEWEGQTYRIGASIGIASSSATGSRSLKDLMIAADTACFSAKELGRNRVQIYLPDEEYFRQRREELRSVAQLDSALANGRFVLYYQRLTPLSVGSPTHAEILLRVKNTADGIDPPANFIHAAERYNLMPYIDRWVVESTCRQVAKWQNDGRDVGIERFAINISGSTLSDERFPDFVLGQIKNSGVDPKRLCFEITESAAVSNLAPALNFIECVRQIGATVALDDFGSGLSSFAYLKRFRADYLKIDGIFVSNIDSDETNFSTVQAMVTLARAHHLSTIAEFVHNASVLDIIRKLGVNYAQGFHLHKPEPLAALSEW